MPDNNLDCNKGCKDCVDKDICDGPDDEYYDFGVDPEDDYYDFGDEHLNDSNNTDMQGYVRQ